VNWRGVEIENALQRKSDWLSEIELSQCGRVASAPFPSYSYGTDSVILSAGQTIEPSFGTGRNGMFTLMILLMFLLAAYWLFTNFDYLRVPHTT
jgi:hypothetical protein